MATSISTFRNPESWRPFAEGKGVTVLFGDDEFGPFAFFSSFRPTDEQMPLSFSHAHPCDNWRISIRRTTNMGRDAYTEGQFRYHDGGVPYASDNVAWGMPAIATTLGKTQRVHLNGGFEPASTWPEVADGVRISLGLLGEPERGPVIILIDAGQDAEVLPTRFVDTEVLLMPISGQINAGDATLEQGSIRLEDAQSSASSLTEAESGGHLWL